MFRRGTSIFTILATALFLLVPGSPAFTQDEPKSNQFWWPEKLSLKPLRQHAPESDPMGKGFEYAEEFKSMERARDSNPHGHGHKILEVDREAE